MKGAAEYAKELFKFPITAVEVGVERGLNALAMLENMSLNKLYLVDTYEEYTDYLGGFCPKHIQDEVYSQMFNRLQNFLDKIVFITRPSVFASTLFPDEFFDFVYIDGNHNYDAVREDIISWYPKVKKGGLLSGHDFDPRNVVRQDVAEAVKDFTKENNLELKIFPYEQIMYSDWGIIK